MVGLLWHGEIGRRKDLPVGEEASCPRRQGFTRAGRLLSRSESAKGAVVKTGVDDDNGGGRGAKSSDAAEYARI